MLRNASPQQRREVKLLALLEEYRDLFDGSLGKWKAEKYDIELKPNAKLYHARAFPIPRVHEQSLRMEVDRLYQEGVLRKINDSEWWHQRSSYRRKTGQSGLFRTFGN